MKICHMTSAHNQDDTRIFHKECVSLAKAGYATYLVARGESCERNGVHIVGLGQPSGGRLSRVIKFSRLVYQSALKINADIYHLHDPELLPYGLKLKKKGKKVIFDSHEFHVQQIREKEYIPVFLREFVANVYGYYEKYIFSVIDAVLIPCTYRGENVIAKITNKSAIIGNHPLSKEFFDHYNPDTIQENYVCYAGGLSYSRGITHAIKAAAKANIRLVLAGGYAPVAYREEVRRLPEFSIVDERGMVRREEVRKIYAHSLAGICTLLNVGQYHYVDILATKVYEYMAMGIPVILNDYAYAREVMEKYRFGILVDPSDVDAISAAILYLKDHPEEAKEMGKNGRRAVEEEFNWETQEKVLLKLYRDLEVGN